MNDVKKVTCRSSRKASADHNDRNFDLEKAPHIDSEKTKLNEVWACVPGVSFEEAELKFYENRYNESLEQQNARHKARRQYKRIKTMKDVLDGPNTRPDETILQIGNAKNNKDVTPEDFAECVSKYIARLRVWSEQNGGHVHLLDYAMHFDEASPHAHLRMVYDYTDADGVVHIGQEHALEQAGFELPDPSKKVGRYNNRKIQFSTMCREMWADICEAHGYEIDRTPDPEHQNHLSVQEWKALEDEREALEHDRAAFEQEKSQAAEALRGAAELRDRYARHCRREGIRIGDGPTRDSHEIDRQAAALTHRAAETPELYPG